MRKQIIAATAALAFGTSLTLAAQAPAAGAQGASQAPAAAPKPVTLVGCVEFEQDYRKRMAAGRGGVLGTGIEAGDEFVLTNVRPAGAAVGTTGEKDAKSKPEPPGAGGGVYTLTGDQEKNLKRDVGRQVEIVGVLENAGKPGTGAELTDISDLPRVAITTWHPVGDFCPGSK